MLKIIKYLKKSVVSIIAIFLLLVVGAICDLSLPDYTSKIVNVGIQQGGIENPTPNVIRKAEMDKLFLFINKADQDIVLQNYDLLKKGSSQEYAPLEKEDMFKLKDGVQKDKEKVAKLDDIFAKPMLITGGIESGAEQVLKMEEEMKKNLPPQMLEQNLSTFEIMAMMPPEQLTEMQEKIDKQFDELPDSIVKQSAVAYTQNEYKAIKIDTDKTQTDYILIAGLKMLAIALLSMATSIMVGFLASRVAAKLGRDLRNSVFKKVISFSNTEMDEFSTASLITRSTNDIQQVQMLMVMLLRIVFYAPIVAVGGVVKVFSTNTSMAWIIGIAVVAILMIFGVLYLTVMPKFKVLQKLVDKLNLVTREILTGIPVIRAFSKQTHEEKRFDKANSELTKVNLFVNRVMTCMMPLMMLVMNLITILIMWNGAHSINSGAMQVGDLMAFIQYTMQIIMAFLMISMMSIMLPRAAVSAGRIGEILETTPAINDPKNPKVPASNKKGFIEFKDVSFRYPNAQEDVISHASFSAKPGQTTAFIGSTGSGKSTLINLIPRFYDVTGGEILIDDVNIKDMTQHELHNKLGYVPQKGVLFSGTIESNLKFGGENISDDEMKLAAEISQSADFIKEIPGDYKSAISQGGTNVSGGQKQRLSIARAIAKKPEIYIFDDSFSALDYQTDINLRQALSKQTANSTVLIVAQRISTILHADQIVVLDEGTIVGVGTHQQLLHSCDIYKQIALSQLSKEELGDVEEAE